MRDRRAGGRGRPIVEVRAGRTGPSPPPGDDGERARREAELRLRLARCQEELAARDGRIDELKRRIRTLSLNLPERAPARVTLVELPRHNERGSSHRLRFGDLIADVANRSRVATSLVGGSLKGLAEAVNEHVAKGTEVVVDDLGVFYGRRGKVAFVPTRAGKAARKAG